MKIVISSGHGKHIRGASGDPVPPQLDEVDEARKVVETVATNLRAMGADVVTFHDDVSDDQSENLNRIVDFHNAQGPHDLDVSVHFNAYDGSAHGVEVCYLTQEGLADDVSAAIAKAGGFTDRGPKYRDDLFFLHHTAEEAILIETCFCDSTSDSNLYTKNYAAICSVIASTLAGASAVDIPIEIPQAGGPLFKAEGKCSYFGGPDDMGVDADEGLAFIYEYEQAPWLFLEQQPPGTTGLARRLNVDRPYVACRWDYDVTPKTQLAQPYPALVRAPATGKQFLAWPADWGPHQDTGRVADLSPSLMDRLGVTTDDQVEVIYPAPIKKGLFDRLAAVEKKV